MNDISIVLNLVYHKCILNYISLIHGSYISLVVVFPLITHTHIYILYTYAYIHMWNLSECINSHFPIKMNLFLIQLPMLHNDKHGLITGAGGVAVYRTKSIAQDERANAFSGLYVLFIHFDFKSISELKPMEWRRTDYHLVMPYDVTEYG